MSPLAFPRLTRDVLDRWQATCRTCGWRSTQSWVKSDVEYQRRIHGPEKTCTRGGRL